MNFEADQFFFGFPLVGWMIIRRLYFLWLSFFGGIRLIDLSVSFNLRVFFQNNVIISAIGSDLLISEKVTELALVRFLS